jgi:hypothetical protein
VVVGLLAAVPSSGCNAPRSPDAVTLDQADAGELTCDERARAQGICTSAMQSRCDSQSNDCESSCDVQGTLPANTEKAPSTRGDMESTQCRANCRQVHDACVRSLAQRCPTPCP